MTNSSKPDLQKALDRRYSDAPVLADEIAHSSLLHSMASRGSCRDFLNKPVSEDIVQLLCATALASPSKSDLQQRDIVLLDAPSLRQHVSELVSGQAWVANAPMIAVFCGNNRRQRLLHDWHGVPFANNHLDAFFNATADAAIALGTFVTAAEALGLGCCPISAVRNEAKAISELLHLPDYVFPLAGLAFGYPSQAPTVSKRLPLQVTCHIDRYRESGLQNAVQAYDKDRTDAQPYDQQRLPDVFSDSTSYGWSEDKVRQYSQAERADFGEFIRAKRFCLD